VVVEEDVLVLARVHVRVLEVEDDEVFKDLPLPRH
jgi:hypothetical protein